MSTRNIIVMESAIAAAAVVGLLAQVGRAWSRWSLVREVRAFNKAALWSPPEAAAEAALRLSKEMPDPRLALARARWLLAAGKRDQARSEYAALASKATSPEVAAAAELGLGATLLAPLSSGARPSEENVRAAIEAFGRAQAKAPGLPDAAAFTAAAKLWASDVDGARVAAEAGSQLAKLPSAEAQATLFCVRGYLAASRGDLSAALAEYRRAATIAPAQSGPLGSHAAAALSALEFEIAALPGAGPELRGKLVKRLVTEGPKALSDPSLRPAFVRAAVACARSSSAGERQAGADFLAKAAATRGKDRSILILRAALAAEELAPLWAKAEAAAGTTAASRQAPDARQLLSEVLPGGGPEKSPAARQANPVLAQIAAAEKAIMEDLRTAATEAASEGESGAAEAFAIASYLFRWKMRQAELSADAQERAANELAAAAIAAWADELLGRNMPRTSEAALLLRNAGIVYERRLEREKSLAFFKRSLEIDQRQEDLRALLEGGGASMVSVYPANARLQPLAPVVGAEFVLPPEVPSLAACKVEAFLGPKGGELAQVTPVISLSGVWCAPAEKGAPEGLLEARFVVTDPLGRKTEAISTFRVDTSAPEITRREPAPGGMIRDRQPLVRIAWRDACGVEADSVEVVLEPVRAESVRQVLVTGGRQKGPRIAEPVKWRARDPAVTGESGPSGEVVTSPSSELPVGVYRVRVSMRDPFQHLREDSWTFTIE